ncbi:MULTISPECIES: ATP-binding protein [unclassified Microcoleus]|uniref:ATP-binding protein n=1 Tax=unclassified Microcoleus TaxID=2642155 RepID=UPI0025F43EB0|nr:MULTISPECIES: ATP-binding protein [unclassified Microcoleus]
MLIIIMGRSLRVSPGCIEQVQSAVVMRGFASKVDLAETLRLSRSTVTKFLAGQPVDYRNFVEISEKLGFKWNTIATLEITNPQSPQPNSQQIFEETSSFITGNPITHPRCFFGREKELKRLFNLLKRLPLQNAAIIGKKRSGKTSLLQYLKNITTTSIEQLRPNQKSDWLPNPENYRWIFVDFQDSRLQNREGLLRYILESLKMAVPNPCDLDRFMDVVSRNLHQPTVILLDEIGVGLQRCPELDDGFWESLRSLATNQTNGNLGFVLAAPESPIELATSTGHSSPFFNIFGYTTTLGAMTEPEARELISSSPIPFADEDVEWILNQSKCWPLLLQILCRERLFSLEEGETGDDWHEEGLQQIKLFAHF